MFNKMINIVRDIEENVTFDVEANSHWYCISYIDNKITLQEVDQYSYDGDEWGVIETKTNVYKLKEFNCTLEEYISFIISFFHKKIEYMKYEYPQHNYVLTKIDIMR